jgi:hypothetical protein
LVPKVVSLKNQDEDGQNICWRRLLQSTVDDVGGGGSGYNDWANVAAADAIFLIPGRFSI